MGDSSRRNRGKRIKVLRDVRDRKKMGLDEAWKVEKVIGAERKHSCIVALYRSHLYGLPMNKHIYNTYKHNIAFLPYRSPK